jgi:hypothetical protein
MQRRRVLVMGGLLGGGLLLVGPGAGGALDAGLQLPAIAKTVQEVDLRWSPSASMAGCATTIWRDGTSLAVLCAPAGTFVDTTVTPGTRYRYQVISGAGGAGPAISNEVTVTTPSLPDGPDLGPPSEPPDLQAVATDAGVVVDWQNASDDTEVSAYEIRRDGLLIALVDAATLQYVDTPTPPGPQVTYSVTAVDVLGQVSRPAVVVVDLPSAPPPTDTVVPTSSAAPGPQQTKEAP